MNHGIIFALFCINTVSALSLLFSTVLASSSETPVKEQTKKLAIYGCGELYNIHCEPLPNKFESMAIHGKINEIYEVRSDLVEFANGSHGMALVLHDYYEAPDQNYIPNNALLNSKKVSISFWLKPYNSLRFSGQVVSHVNSPHTAGWFFDTHINLTGSNRTELLKFSVTNLNGDIVSPPPVTINPGTFTHIVGTFDGNFAKLYVNGVLYGSEKYDGKYHPDPRKPVAIGMNSSTNRQPWSGYIDDLRIYNRVLEYDTVKQIFDNSSRDKSGLVGHWPFDGNLDDTSGNKNNVIATIPVVSMDFTPDGRLFFTERSTGNVRIMENEKVLTEPFVSVPVHVSTEQGLLGLAIDPHFDENHFIYIYYTSLDNKSTTTPYNKVVRFTEISSRASDEKVIIDKIPASKEGTHAGGALAFGPDDKLYVTVGYANDLAAAQNKSSLVGKVLRINRDGSIPSDNPFPSSPVYTWGHRNNFGIAFDNKGNGVVTENGEARYDEINLLKPGANFGFPTLQPVNLPPQLANSSSVQPIRTYWSPVALAQATFYSGNKFPILTDKFLYTGYNTRNLFALQLNDRQEASKEWRMIFNETSGTLGPTIAVAIGPEGNIYFGGYRIYKIQSLDSEEPRQLSFSIEVESSDGVTIEDLQLYPKDKNIVLKLKNDEASNSFLNLKIPKELIQGVFNVTVLNPNPTAGTSANEIDYTISVRPKAASTGFTFLNIKGLPVSDYRLIINGTQVISRR